MRAMGETWIYTRDAPGCVSKGIMSVESRVRAWVSLDGGRYLLCRPQQEQPAPCRKRVIFRPITQNGSTHRVRLVDA